MWKLILLTLSLILLGSGYITLNIFNIYQDVPVATSISNMIKTNNLILLYFIDQDPAKVYQCGVDILTQIGLKYGKMVKQVYVFDKDRCYYNNISTNKLVCMFEIYNNMESYIIQIDPYSKKAVDMKNRLLVVSPLELENCSNLFN